MLTGFEIDYEKYTYYQASATVFFALEKANINVYDDLTYDPW